jgi:phospholipase C
MEATNSALAQIEHIVVVMLENRSFDHMLGYLSLDGRRPDVDGLTRDVLEKHPGLHHLQRTAFEEWEDPPHGWGPVHRQLADRQNGFVATYDEAIAKRGHRRPADEPAVVMGYYDGNDLPVYDRLAESFCVADTWFASVPGPTWPNRCYAVAGHSGGHRDNRKRGKSDWPLYYLPSFVRFLPENAWRWYSAHGLDLEPATVRAVDPLYLWEPWHSGNFALFANGKDNFLESAGTGTLPAVSWIDPNFFTAATTAQMLKAGKLGEKVLDWLSDLVNSPDRIKNDDHPPGDVRAGQALVRRIANAVMEGKAWDKTLLIVTYDEHGGFFDHQPAPNAAPDDRPDFRDYGIRVPALVISPKVRPRSASSKVAEGRAFDHASIIKTILERCNPAATELMGRRVREAASLSELLDPGSDLEPQPVEAFPQLAEFDEAFPPAMLTGMPEAAAAQTVLVNQRQAVEVLVDSASRDLGLETLAREDGELDELEAGMLALLVEADAARTVRQREKL